MKLQAGKNYDRALTEIASGMVVGLGTGRAAAAFIDALGAKVQTGLQIRGLPTSQASAEQAQKHGIPLVAFDDIDTIDVTCDGADEVDPLGNLIKGYGGALVREKIVAAASKKFVILVGDEKLVRVLGSRGNLPVEVVPFGMASTARHLSKLALSPQPRMAGGKLFVTDNGNHILDCGTGPIDQPADLELQILAIPGTVGTGLFLGMADLVLVQRGEQVEVRDVPKCR
jgi:ribose 5-phosphate isomerase A